MWQKLWLLAVLSVGLSACGCGQAPPGNGSSSSPATRKSAMTTPSNITREARAALDGLGESLRLSLPFVGRYETQFQICVLAYPAVPRPRQASVIYPPGYRIYLDGTTQKLLKRVVIAPGEVVAAHLQGKSIGEYGIPAGMSYEGFLEKEAALHALVPGLCAKMNSAAAANQPADKPGHEYLAVFKTLSEPPLAPYYEKFGKEFFSYLKRQ